MAKRPTVDVDEEYLKEIMAGGISRPKREQPQPEQPTEPSDKEQPKKEEKETAKPTRKKRESHDYETLFLERKASVVRRQTYISGELYDKITGFLSVIAGHSFSVTAYVNNILTHHLERYKEDINELYEQKSKKPF
jgi:hypothetical protein